MVFLKKLIDEEMSALCAEPLSNSHNDILLDELRDYNTQLIEKCYYGAFCVRDNVILFGSEYKSIVAKKFNTFEEARKCFGTEVKDDLREMAIILNDSMLNYVIVPVRVNWKKLDFYFLKISKEEYINIFDEESVADIYENYPFLMSILQTYITCIKASEDVYGQNAMLNEYYDIELYRHSNYYSDKANIVRNIFDSKGLPTINVINNVAKWNYEGAGNRGFLELEHSYAHNNQYIVKFSSSKKLFFLSYEARTIRKFLELSSEKYPLIINSSEGLILMENTPNDYYWTIQGIGARNDNNDHVEFLGNGAWKLYMKNETVLFDGITYKIMQKIEVEDGYNKRIKEYYEMLGKQGIDVFNVKIDTIIRIIAKAKLQKHGTMVIVSRNAPDEAKRLCGCGRGIIIEPINFNEVSDGNMEVIENITKIDGAIMLGEDGVCYAIGVIVDGIACENSNPGRGARYNSAYTYVHSQVENKIPTLAIVISEDGTVDVLG